MSPEDRKPTESAAAYHDEAIRQFYFELERTYTGEEKREEERIWVPWRASLPGMFYQEGKYLEMARPVEVLEAHHWGLKAISGVPVPKGAFMAVTIPEEKKPLSLAGQIVTVSPAGHHFIFHLNVTRAPEFNRFLRFVRRMRSAESSKYYQMSGKERRRFYRLPYVVPVRYQSHHQGSWLAGHRPMSSFNLSAGGIGVESAEILALHQQAMVYFNIREKEYALRAHVMWVDAAKGEDLPRYGLEFLEIPEKIQNEIIQFVIAEQMRRKREHEDSEPPGGKP